MFDVRQFQHGSGPYRMRHHHREGQLFVLSEGLCTFTTEDGEWLMTPGRPCWVPPHLVHETETLGPVAGASLFLDEILCGTLPRNASVLRAAPMLRAVIERLAALPSDSQRVRHLIPVLIDEIAAGEPEQLHLPIPRDPILRRLASDIAAAPHDKRGLEDWSDVLGMPNRTLVRRFKDETGLTFVDWRRRARIMRAVVMMQEGQDIGAIATAVGYESASAFITSFRTATGSSPRQFAMEHHLGQREP